jgi:hypothetical protein
MIIPVASKDHEIIESAMSEFHNAKNLSESPPASPLSYSEKYEQKKGIAAESFRIYTRFTQSSLETYLESQRYPTTTRKLLWISKGLVVKD